MAAVYIIPQKTLNNFNFHHFIIIHYYPLLLLLYYYYYYYYYSKLKFYLKLYLFHIME